RLTSIVMRLRMYLLSITALWASDSRWHRLFFFFQAEDGIRDLIVTGVQTCALPIFHGREKSAAAAACGDGGSLAEHAVGQRPGEIGRASCRERVKSPGGVISLRERGICLRLRM